MSNYSFEYVAEEFYSKKKDKQVYCIRLVMKKGDKIVRKSDALFWIDEDTYLDFIS